MSLSPLRCTTCGCVLRLTGHPATVSLATPDQRKAIVQQAIRDKDTTRIRTELARFGTRPVWRYCFRCPGCGIHGSTGQHFETESEVGVLVAAQEALLATPAAQDEIVHWAEEVERRAQDDAALFAKGFLDRFPHWAHCLTYHQPSTAHGDALSLSIPSENPAVATPLQATVTNGEVLVAWSHWHNHFAIPGRPEHIERALESIAKLVAEEWRVYGVFRNGTCSGGGSVAIDEVPRSSLTDDEKIEYRSWRGTYDADFL